MRKPISNLKAVCADGRVVLTWYKATPFMGAEHEAEFASFRVLRREVPAFVFGADYEEFFWGMGPEGAEAVFQGPLPASNGRKFAWTDDAVRPRTTYAYFVETAQSRPVGPAPVRVRDAEVWWTHSVLKARLERLAGRWPGLASLGVCGCTAAGREIFCLEVGHSGPAIALVGLIHGGESGPELIVPALEELLARSPGLFGKARVVAVPSVNADAREALARGVPWYLRTTPQGVDLNRNFPAGWEERELGYGLDSADPDSGTYRGPAPASAPETRAVMDALERCRPAAVFSCHWLASVCGLPALCARRAAEDGEYMAKCRRLAEEFGKGLCPEKTPEAKWLKPNSSSGSLSAWVYETFGAPCFDLEGSVVDEGRLWATDQTDPATIAEWQERHARGIGRVLEFVGGE